MLLVASRMFNIHQVSMQCYNMLPTITGFSLLPLLLVALIALLITLIALLIALITLLVALITLLATILLIALIVHFCCLFAMFDTAVYNSHFLIPAPAFSQTSLPCMHHAL